MRMSVLAVTAIVLSTHWAGADLLTDRFGVNLSVEFVTADLKYVFNHDWTPTGSPTASWNVHDYSGPWSTSNINSGDTTQITGGEPYDVEAIYLDDDLQNLYIAIVTSFPSPEYDGNGDGNPDGGYFDSRFSTEGDILVHAGDLALDFGINGAMSVDDLFNYDWGVNINNEVRLSSGGGEANATPVLGGSVYQTANSDWYASNDENAADTTRDEMTNFDPAYTDGSNNTVFRGTADVAYYMIDFGEGILENGAETWVIEATIPFSALPTLVPGDPVSAQWVMGCRNDAGTVNNVLRGDHTITPEPGSLALCAIGLSALVGWRRRNRDVA